MTDRAVRVTATSGFWVGLVAVTVWWTTGLGSGTLTDSTQLLDAAGRLAGLGAADLLLVQVLLIARIPVIERAFGQDRLLRQHRLVGFTSVNLMLVHVALIAWGYAGGSLTSTPATFWDLTVNYPGMLLAVAGTVLLLVAATTSVRAARRRLRYESWHLLHLYAYLGTGLALPHQLWTGQEFTRSATATAYWWTLWGAAAGSILLWRVLIPLARSLRHDLRVTRVVDEGDGVTSVYVTGHRLDRLRVEAGQFFTWRFLDREGWTRGNPYSLSAAPDGRSLRVSVKDLGDNSQTLRALRPGTGVLVEGPYGRLSGRARTQRKVALIGAGVGITPLRALAEGLDYAPGDAVALYRFTGQPLFEREWSVLAVERGLRVLWLPGRRRSPRSWLGSGVGPVDDVTALRSWVPDIAERDVYVCGPEGWADAVRRTALVAGVPRRQIHEEVFAW